MATWTAVFDDDEELGELLDLALGDNDATAAAAAAHKRRTAAAAAAIFPQEGGQGPGGKKEKVKDAVHFLPVRGREKKEGSCCLTREPTSEI